MEKQFDFYRDRDEYVQVNMADCYGLGCVSRLARWRKDHQKEKKGHVCNQYCERYITRLHKSFHKMLYEKQKSESVQGS